MFKKMVSFLMYIMVVTAHGVPAYQRKRIGLPRPGKFAISMSSRSHGMFSVFDDVLDLLERYELGYYVGIEVDFGTEGLYYQAECGTNWWSYYCKPIKYGSMVNLRKVSLNDPRYIVHWTTSPYPRKKAHALIKKYIHIKPHIQNKVDAFENANFKDFFVITVHYRGTDKIGEAPLVLYEKVHQEVQTVMKTYGAKKYKIFVATDEQAFLDYMIASFGIMVCCNQDAIRSTNGKPIHFDASNNHYKCGEDAMIDCLLLSKGNVLIKSNSNLSRWSIFFNPKIVVIALNDAYYHW